LVRERIVVIRVEVVLMAWWCLVLGLNEQTGDVNVQKTLLIGGTLPGKCLLPGSPPMIGVMSKIGYMEQARHADA
jgi:hypothetical protein